jgi:hypothetical protein
MNKGTKTLFFWHSTLDGERTVQATAARPGDPDPRSASETNVWDMNVRWKFGISTGHWAATHRGIRILIDVDRATGKASEIQWFIGGRLDSKSPVDCAVDAAKKLSIIVIDRRILEDHNWAAAEAKDRRSQSMRHNHQ